MKAVSPVRSIRKPALYFSEHNHGNLRSKSSSDDPLSLLYNMNDCYSRLKELVPSLPQNKSVSKMEILQHVIDYILDLQIALDQNPQQQILGQSPPKKSVRSLGADISILSFQVQYEPGCAIRPLLSQVDPRCKPVPVKTYLIGPQQAA
uniref:DNA-binding protein inhibitor ID-4 n=1 Tax=Cyprinus carpio carpio TaxID=630221 RepID=A0A9J8BWZ4_CYPCA